MTAEAALTCATARSAEVGSRKLTSAREDTLNLAIVIHVNYRIESPVVERVVLTNQESESHSTSE